MFIVMETCYSYNDETYYCEDESGLPKRVFETRQEAEDEAGRLQTDKILEQINSNCPNLAHYCYELYEITKEDHDFESLSKAIKDICGRDLNGNDYELGLDVEGLTEDQRNRIADLFSLSFFFVAECE